MPVLYYLSNSRTEAGPAFDVLFEDVCVPGSANTDRSTYSGSGINNVRSGKQFTLPTREQKHY